MIPTKPKDTIWTDEQWLAIHDSGHNIIVSAGAGSGKTAVLSERVITNIKKGIHINEMLLLTFTKAAANEMKERIRKKIKKEKELTNELDLIDSAYITTFDSFALSIVKKYHYILNLSKNISIIDSAMISIKKTELLDELLEEYYDEKNIKFLNLINDFCIKDDKEIKSAILKINSKLDMLADKQEYLNAYIEKNYQQEKIEKDIKQYESLLNEKINEITELIKDLSCLVDSEYIEKVNNSLVNLLNSRTYNEIHENLNIKLPILPRGSDDETKSKKEQIGNILKELNELCKYENIENIKNSIYKTKDNVEILIEIIKKLDNRIFDYKFKLDSFEYNDIALFAIKILKENSEIRSELKYFFKEIMIDEYQDTNDLQEIFISMIENNNVYMVGDIKQSIYRFRNANPDIFKQKYENYANKINGEKIDLNKNFRSRSEVLENINLMFKSIMDSNIGGADYSISHQMIFGNQSYNKKGKTEQNNNFEIYEYEYCKDTEYSKEEIECFLIAKDIKEKINNKYKVFDKDEEIIRDITYNDFVILMDRTTNFDLYKKIFEYEGIPLAMLKDEKMNEDQDIMVLNNLIKFLVKVNKYEFDSEFRYLFISIMRSYVFEINDDGIFNYFVENNFKESELFQKIKEISKNINNLSSYEIILKIINEFNIYENLIKIGNIKAATTKINYILDSAKNLSDLGYNIYDFTEYLKKIQESDYEMKYQVNIGNSNSVKIMTIHKSKGLEYHICYYSGLYKNFNILDLKERFMYDKKYGIITPYFDEGIGQTIYKDLAKEEYLKDEISEKIRLLYVALTRAKEKMILIVPTIDNIISNETSNNIVSDNIRLKYRSFLDILNSISNKTKKYYKKILLDDLNISKEYNLIKKSNYIDKIPNDNKIIDVKELLLKSNTINSQTFSKKTSKLITRTEREKMNYGTHIHELLENIDFKKTNLENINDKYLKEKISLFFKQDIIKNIKNAKIFKEYEFIYEEDNTEYHGIIDLMLEYKEHIDIIDYKLKNINDENYIKQLNGYKNYISQITNKVVNIYLYSILDNIIEEVK